MVPAFPHGINKSTFDGLCQIFCFHRTWNGYCLFGGIPTRIPSRYRLSRLLGAVDIVLDLRISLQPSVQGEINWRNLDSFQCLVAHVSRWEKAATEGEANCRSLRIYCLNLSHLNHCWWLYWTYWTYRRYGIYWIYWRYMYNIYIYILYCLYRLDMPMMNSGSIIYIPYIQIHHEPSQYWWASILSLGCVISQNGIKPAKMMRMFCSYGWNIIEVVVISCSQNIILKDMCIYIYSITLHIYIEDIIKSLTQNCF